MATELDAALKRIGANLSIERYEDGRIAAVYVGSAIALAEAYESARHAIKPPESTTAEPVAWQPGEQAMAIKWLAALAAKLGTKPDHADDVLWLTRLHALLSAPAHPDRAVKALREALAWFVDRERPIQAKFTLHGPKDLADAMLGAFDKARAALRDTGDNDGAGK